MIFSLEDRRPDIRGEHYVAENAMVIGSVVIERHVSVWFNTVIRGDNDLVTLGEGSNVQDGAVLHVDPGVPLTLGRRVTVGHMAMLHGCTIGDRSLIGIKAVVLNHAVIGRDCIIGANALVTEGKRIPDGSLVLGSPGRVVRALDERERAGLAEFADHYVANAARYRQGLRAWHDS